jgi:lycopene cyclase domain-containing protein
VPEQYYYLAIDVGVVLIPFLASFHPRLGFHRHLAAFAIACLLTLIPFIAWDIAFTEAGIWGFNPRFLTGLSVLGLPVEEWLFFICIPYACVFVFHCLGLLKQRFKPDSGNTLLRLLSIVFLVIAGVFSGLAYTCMTFLLAGIVLGWLSWVQKPAWLFRAIVAYLAVIPFFFISNGVLTGAWIPEEIVWYDNTENLGVRMGTIPLEDTFYGFILILLNVMLFERLKSADKIYK